MYTKIPKVKPLKTTTELIEYYREEENLWDVTLDHYKDKNERKDALLIIALKLGVTGKPK